MKYYLTLASKLIWPLIFSILLVYIFILRECTPKIVCPEPTINTSDTTSSHTDTVTIDNTKHYPKPKPDTVIVVKHDTVQVYNRRLDFDTLGYIDIRDTISKNSLQGYTVNSHLNTFTTTKYITKTIQSPLRASLLVGAAISYKADNTMTAIPLVMLKTKKQHYYFVGYNPFDKQFQAGGYWKLF